MTEQHGGVESVVEVTGGVDTHKDTHVVAAKDAVGRVLGTAAFYAGLAGGNFPRGAAIALCMVPILAVAATLILRSIARRGSEV